MKIRLLIHLNDFDYCEQLSKALADHYQDTFQVTVLSETDTNTGKFDVALFDDAEKSEEIQHIAKLPVLLCETEMDQVNADAKINRTRKYQRISSLTGLVLQLYADVAGKVDHLDLNTSRVTAVWSPVGGSGKTTVALAYALKMISEGNSVLYLDLEDYSSTDVYFSAPQQGISKALTKLDSNLELILKGLLAEDKSTKITYFGKPDNYDDINALTPEDIQSILSSCRQIADVVIVDLSSSWNGMVRTVMENADAILTVVSETKASSVKWTQFTSQHDAYESFREKMTLVRNRQSGVQDKGVASSILLPVVPSSDPISVYKTLSANLMQ